MIRCVLAVLAFGFGSILLLAATNTPISIELRDQFDTSQTLTFPGTNIVLLTIADKKGSEQIDGWIVALKSRYASKVTFQGLADCGGAPFFLHKMIRRKFQEKHRHSVMLDWSGKIAAQYGYQAGLANLIILRRDGAVHFRHAGPAAPASVEKMCVELDKAIRAEGR